MLKSLDVFGFKSFADRTRFDFDPGITAVVGPNGSGKSNVVDAVKWILGDQSPKSLRGSEMTDVIFNGTGPGGRKASAFSEAVLTIDNSSGFLPVESQEVQVGRRLWRSGDAEYLINGSTARLKDVRALFMGTGAGTAAYCIIEQGRVDQIFKVNSVNRRAVFEEAAGVSRFKAKKIEALRKLERVEQNLTRLTDIVDEVDGRLTATRNQAEKAARYRDLTVELRELWTGLAADDYRVHSALLAGVDERIAAHTAELDAANARQQETEGRLSGLDDEIAVVDERLREVERLASVGREAIARHEVVIRQQASRHTEQQSEIDRLRRRRAESLARSREVAGEIDWTQDRLTQCEADFTEKRREIENSNAEIEHLAGEIEAGRTALEESRDALFERTRDVSDAGRTVTTLRTRLEGAGVALEAAQQRRDEIAERVDASRDDCTHRGERVADARRELADAERAVNEVRARREAVLEDLSLYQTELAELRETRSAWQARKSVLEDLESRQEGLGVGVREILSRAKSSEYPPWNQILGGVADLLEVDLENAALLEVALGARAQLIVTREFGQLFEYLRGGSSRISGRVGFVLLNTSPKRKRGNEDPNTHQPDAQARDAVASQPPSLARRASVGDFLKENESDNIDALKHNGNQRFAHFQVAPDDLPDLSGRPGVQHRADELVGEKPEYAGLAAQLLADTWIVETLDAALELSTNAGRGCRFVTMQGELLDADGTLVVGAVRSELALVSRKSELRRLKLDLDKLDRRIADEETRLAGLDGELNGVNEELALVESDLQTCADRHASLQADLSGRQEVLARLEDQHAAAETEASEAVDSQQTLETELEQAALKQTNSEELLSRLQAEIDAADGELIRAERELHSLEHRQSQSRLELAKQEERLEGLQTALARLQQDQVQRNEQSDESERRVGQVESRLSEITLTVLNAQAEMSEAYIELDAHAEQVRRLAVERSAVRKQRATILAEEADVRDARRRAADLLHAAEMEARDSRSTVENLCERIQEEYQLDLAELAAGDASAYRRHLEAEYGVREETTDDDQASELAAEVDSETDPEAETVVPSTGSDAESETNNPTVLPEDLPAFEDVRGDIEKQVNRLRKKLKVIGSVNTDSLRDLDDLEERYRHMKGQLDDLVEAKLTLEQIVRKINVESRRMFLETFEVVRDHFRELFRKAFGGGEGDLILEDPEDVLESGIDIIARPPGKDLKSNSLLSGGEKTLTAFALLLAIFRSRPSPYCFLDEVDAALDDANISRLIALLNEFRETTQFVMITHRKPTMAIADVLYGVTMQEAGVSKRLSVKFEEVNDNGEFATTGTEPQARAA